MQAVVGTNGGSRGRLAASFPTLRVARFFASLCCAQNDRIDREKRLLEPLHAAQEPEAGEGEDDISDPDRLRRERAILGLIDADR